MRQAFAAHSRCSRDRQPRVSDAYPRAAFPARRRREAAQFESQTSFTLPLVWHWPRHTVQQQPDKQPASAVHSDIGESVHTPRRSKDTSTYPSTHPHHCCTHNSHLPAHQLAQLARILACNCRNTERTRTRTRHKQCSTTAADDASQQGAHVAAARSFLGDRGSKQGIVNR